MRYGCQFYGPCRPLIWSTCLGLSPPRAAVCRQKKYDRKTLHWSIRDSVIESVLIPHTVGRRFAPANGLGIRHLPPGFASEAGRP
jgi:hypothetical protein